MKFLTIFIILFSVNLHSFPEDDTNNDDQAAALAISTDFGVNDFEHEEDRSIKVISLFQLDVDANFLAIHSQFFEPSQRFIEPILVKKVHQDIDSQYISSENTFAFQPHSESEKLITIPEKINLADYWETLYSVESKQGLLLYRPSNKSKSCATAKGPCGHHQLTAQALRDIKCVKQQCKKDRENYKKSLAMSKKLDEINNKRMLKTGYKNLPEYQKYLIHQQGASGISTILAASDGKKLLSKRIKRNMANNSPYSYKSLRKMGSKLAAEQFMKYWQSKWDDEKKMLSLTQNTSTPPLLTEYELQVALNIKL